MKKTILFIIICLVACVMIGCKPKKTQVVKEDNGKEKMIAEVIKDSGIYQDGCISCSLQVEKNSLSNTIVKVIFRNETDFTIPIEKRHLFIDLNGKQPSLENPTIEVFLNGEDVTFDIYEGKMVKRKASVYPQDFHLIQKHESYEVTINLNKFYDLSKKGKYSVKYYAFNCIDFDLDEPCCFSIESPNVIFEKNKY